MKGKPACDSCKMMVSSKEMCVCSAGERSTVGLPAYRDTYITYVLFYLFLILICIHAHIR